MALNGRTRTRTIGQNGIKSGCKRLEGGCSGSGEVKFCGIEKVIGGIERVAGNRGV